MVSEDDLSICLSCYRISALLQHDLSHNDLNMTSAQSLPFPTKSIPFFVGFHVV